MTLRAGESDVDALGDGRMPDILGDRMRIVPGVVDVGHILDPVSKGVAVEACIKRHAVSCIGGIEPSLYGDGHRERWRVQILLDGMEPERRSEGDEEQ